MRKRPSSAAMEKMILDEEDFGHKRTLLRRIMASAFFPLLAALYYIAVSVSLTLFNKLLFSKFPTSNPSFLLICQSVTAVSILSLLRLTGKFSAPNFFSWPMASWRAYAPLFVSNLAMLLTSLLALKFTSLLMYNTLRRTSMVFVVAIHCMLYKTNPSVYTVGATTLVTLGAFFATRADLAFDPLGYALALSANISTAIYLVFLRPVRDTLQLSNLQLIYVNAFANIPVLAVVMLALPPDDNFLLNFKDMMFAGLFLCSCSLALVINHAIFVNTTTNDAIAQSIASQLKDVVLLVISIVFIDDPTQRAAGNLQGVFVGFLGSLVYGVGKLLERQANKATELAKQAADNEKPDIGAEKVRLVTADVKAPI